jgi:two-component system KDP operon response regulator KdpE
MKLGRVDMGRALLVEESAELRNKFSEYLQERGIDVYVARGAADARALLPALKPDVTTLDIDFADGDGFNLIEDIGRAGSRCLIISDRDQVQDRIRALSLGADDYVTKPIDLEELYLRLRNILANRGANRAAADVAVIDLHGVKVDLVSRALLNRNGAPGPELTETELSLLRVLADAMDRVIHKEQLFMTVYGRSYTTGTRSLDVTVSRLRLKLKATDIAVELRSVRQAGYMLSQSLAAA